MTAAPVPAVAAEDEVAKGQGTRVKGHAQSDPVPPLGLPPLRALLHRDEIAAGAHAARQTAGLRIAGARIVGDPHRVDDMATPRSSLNRKGGVGAPTVAA